MTLTMVVSYTYDSWGKLLSVKDGTGADKINDPAFLGNINPLRYKGYLYDNETGLYYLQSRYYNTQIERFINSDSILFTSGIITNVFAYCMNSPIIHSDLTGSIGTLNIPSRDGGAPTNEETRASTERLKKLRDSAIIVLATGRWVKGISKPYSARIDPPETELDQKHIHIYKNDTEVANQNQDGSPRHSKKNTENPPPWLKKQLKEKADWDWDKNRSDYVDKIRQWPELCPEFPIPFFPPIPVGVPLPALPGPMPIPIPVIP